MAFTPGPLSVRTESRNGVGIVAVTGELDMGTAPLLDEHLERFQQDGVGTVVLDLRALSFLDPSGLHALVDAKERAATNGRHLLVVGASPSTRRVLELIGTDFLLDGQDAASVLARFTRKGPPGQDGPADGAAHA
jgi:anti-sigma B factor antagonist